VSDGGFTRPLSIVDLETRLEVGTASTGGDCNSVDFCDQDTLVGTSHSLGRIVVFSLASDGTPSLTGEHVLWPYPNNATCAPGGLTAVTVSRAPTARLRSFEVDGLATVATRPLYFGLSACFSRDGRRLFVRQTQSVEAWTFDPLTGALGDAPLFSIPADYLEEFYGMERIALHPDGSRLYVPVWQAVRIHAPESGDLLDTKPVPVLASPGGIAIASGW
jgi:sugar lactone lactonase YvrE